MPKLNNIQELRSNAYRNQAGRCFYCNCLMWLEKKEEHAKMNSLSSRAAERFRCTAEHLIPRSEGGKDTNDNIVAACLFCNHNRHRRKKPPVPLEYKKQIREQINRGKWFPKELRSRISF